ncbi:proline iminopeptidase [Pluteus cervinus]|uniref:Proline iminopeptidase n=1 Tax=Pluteus cervinus TaxID=181527 RepID=A0ACD3AKT2_9AGAR|nr:proline iminopeptidase [Pluteus cervinus]
MSRIEGEFSYHVPGAGKECKTWYIVFGDLSSGRRPLVALHGGPGAVHTYLIPMSGLTTAHGIPLILYDQLGNGNSTHLPEKIGDTSFWTTDLFLDQLDALLKHFNIQDNYDLLGHSWGGMLASAHASLRQPTGLKHLVIVSSPADMKLWVEAANKLREMLPVDVKATLKKHEDAGTTHEKEYTEAVEVFYKRHLCLIDPLPSWMAETMQWLEKDPTVYGTMNGPSEFHITGSLKDWSIISDLHKITAPTLLINGLHDEAQDSVMYPFFKNIPKVKWVTFQNSSHTCHFEEPDKFVAVTSGFLRDQVHVVGR